MKQALIQLLKPLARFCLRRGITLQTLVECLKRALVEAAAEELKLQEDSLNVSRVSVMTGVHRKDVTAILQAPQLQPDQRDLISRVIGHWQQHPDYRTAAGKPRQLKHLPGSSEFDELVRQVSADIRAPAIISELKRIGAVQLRNNRLKLVADSYIAAPGDTARGLSMLGRDLRALFQCVDENINAPVGERHHHLRTSYDNIPARFKGKIRAWLIQEGNAFHERTRAFLGALDRDLNPMLRGEGTLRVTMGSFSLSEDIHV